MTTNLTGTRPWPGARRPASLARTLSVFVLLSIILLGVLVTISVSLRVGQVITESQEQNIQREISRIAEQFSSFLLFATTVLRDHAKFPVMTQAAMQPTQYRGIIQDFMKDLGIFGELYQEALVDFECRTIHVAHKEAHFDYRSQAWCHGLIDGKDKTYIGISSETALGRYYWRIAVPIVYNGYVEGALVAEVPFKAIEAFHKLSAHLAGMYVEILRDGTVIETFGEPLQGPPRDILLSDLGATLRFRVDQSRIAIARYRLLGEMGAILLVLTGLIVSFSIHFGRKMFVRPLEKLQVLTTALADGTRVEPVPVDHNIRELAVLARDFNFMVERVQQREADLRRNRDELSRVNQELQASQNRLVHSEKMASVGTLAAGVAHEINNPVGFIMSNLGSLSQYIGTFKRVIGDYDAYTVAVQEGDSSRQQAILGRIEEFKEQEDLSYVMKDVDELIAESTDGTKRVKEIVQGLKNFARVDESEIQEADLNECIEATLKVVWNELKYKCEVHKEFGVLPRIRCYPGQLNQVFMNLLVNAAQAIPERGEVRIQTEATDTHIVIQISDTGKGIPEENIARIFDPFFTTKAVGDGTGLGLSISYGIVQKHNGTMEIESQVGEGTTFTIRLPIEGVQDE